MYPRPFSSPETATIFQIKKITARLDHWTIDITRTLDAKYNPSQPRVPRGNSDGGQWTDGAGGGLPRGKPSTALKPQRKPPHLTAPKTPRIRPALSAEELARFNRNAPEGTPPGDLEIDPAYGLPRWYVGGAVNPTWSPLDFIGGPVSAQGRLATGEAIHAGRIYGRQFLARETAKLTDHGTVRVGQRLNSAEDINEAVQSAIKTGKIIKKIGNKYKTPQFHYEGDNGLTVIIETQGRNAGKVITTYGKNPGGKI